MASIMGSIIKNADTLVVAVPTLVFVTLLPGLLYFELAFDIQRSVYAELLLCTLPASAAALLLRTVCAYESINAGVLWTTKATISGTSMYVYVVMLVLDLVVYSGVMYGLAVWSERKIEQTAPHTTGTHTNNTTTNTTNPITNITNTTSTSYLDVVYSYTAYILHSIGSSVYSVVSGVSSVATETVQAPISTHTHLTAADIEESSESTTPGSDGESSPLIPDEATTYSTTYNTTTPHHTTTTHHNALHTTHTTHHTPHTHTNHAALKVRSVTKQYTTGGTSIVVLSDVNANLVNNSVTLLLGSNGAGKTTLMKVLCGLDRYYSGSVTLQSASNVHSGHSGHSVHTTHPTLHTTEHTTSHTTHTAHTTTTPPSARSIGWCPQNDALFEDFTVEEHIVLFTEIIYGTTLHSNHSSGSTLSNHSSSMNAFVRSTLSKLDMFSHAHKAVCALSGGMKRRLSLSLAFLGQPKVLFLDEPTSGCDAWTRELVRKDILSRRDGCAILISTHHTDDIEVLADRVWFLSERYLEVDEAVQDLAAWRSRELAKNSKNSNNTNNMDGSSSGSRNGTGDTDVLSGVGAVNMTTSSSINAPALHTTHRSVPHTTTTLSTTNTSALPHTPPHFDEVAVNGGHAMEFSTCDARVKSVFIGVVGEEHSSVWVSSGSVGISSTSGSDSVGDSVCTTWIVPVDYLHLLRTLVHTLEVQKLYSWSLNTCSMYSTLCHLYDKDMHNTSSNSTNYPTNNTTLPDSNSTHPYTPTKRTSYIFVHIYAILYLRCIELYKRVASYLLAQLLLPFIVVLCIAVGCSDVKYPKTEISSGHVGGLGEMLVAQGNSGGVSSSVGISSGGNRGIESDIYTTTPSTHATHIHSPLHTSTNTTLSESIELSTNTNTNSNSNSNDDLFSLLLPTTHTTITATPTNTTSTLYNTLATYYSDITYAGYMHSDNLFDMLFSQYYAHTDDRWAAFVVHDSIPQWLTSTVSIEQSALSVDVMQMYEEVVKAQREVCSGGSGGNRDDSMDGAMDGGIDVSSVYNSVYSSTYGIDSSTSTRTMTDTHQYNITDASRFCGSIPSISIQIHNTTTNTTYTSTDHTAQYNNLSIAVTSYESLHSNLTLLSNVTSDHAAPTYLKEIIPAIYTIMQDTAYTTHYPYNTTAHSTHSTHTTLPANYLLYSHPLPLSNRSNEVYLARGYLGSTIVVLYMLITTIVCVRTVIKLRYSGVKTQLHLASMQPFTFWFANFLFDSMLICTTLLCILLAIVVGGAPISNYFFECPPFPGALFILCIVCFSMAVVASSYMCVVFSVDQLSSQMLMLILTVAGGVFMKLYLDRHSGGVYDVVVGVLLRISPCYTYSTAVFDLINIHVLVVSASAQGKAGPDLDTLLHSVYSCCGIMCIQAVVYLGLCVALDMYGYKVRACVGKWRWYYSTVYSGGGCSGSSINNNGIGDSSSVYHNNTIADTDTSTEEQVDERSTLLSRTIHTAPPNNATYGSTTTNTITSNTTTHPSNTPSTHAPRGILKHLYMHPHDKIGIFPIVHPAEYKMLTQHAVHNNTTSLPRYDIEGGGGGVGSMYQSGVYGSVYRSMYSNTSNTIHNITNTYDTHTASTNIIPTDTTTTNNIPIVHAQNLTVTYNTSKLSLYNTTFTILPSEHIALMGMNGGGKSTLFNTLALAQNVPVHGTLHINSYDSVDGMWSISGSSSVGYVPQEKGLCEFMTVAQSLQFFAMVRPARDSSSRSSGVYSTTSATNSASNHTTYATTRNTNPPRTNPAPATLAHTTTPLSDDIIPTKYYTYPVHALSGGTRKKLAVKIANMGEPDLLLLDECTTGVDPVAAERIVRYLKYTVHPSQALLFASHRIDESIAVCGRVLMLVQGQVYLDGPISAFHDLAYRFYQVDITLPTTTTPTSTSTYTPTASTTSTHTLTPTDAATTLTTHTATVLHTTTPSTLTTLHTTPTIHTNTTPMTQLLHSLTLLYSAEHITRTVQYSETKVRITFEKHTTSISSVWNQLATWQRSGVISTYAFRNMEMEEVLSSIIQDTQM